MALTEYKVLLLENDDVYEELVRHIVATLQDQKYRYVLETQHTIDSGIKRLKAGGIDIIILSLMLTDSDDYHTFERLHSAFPDLPIIVLADKQDINLAIKIIRNGAEDFLVKTKFQQEQFIYAVQFAIERSRIEQQKHRLANFAEWNTHPIIELNIEGVVVYLNLSARAQFPDLAAKGLAHPLLRELKEQIFDLLPKQHSEMIIFNREVAINDRNYEQQIFVLPNSGIYMYVIDSTERNKLRSQALLSDRLATVGTLAAGVAHEINNPIAWVLENLRYLKEHLTDLKNYINSLSEIIQAGNNSLQKLQEPEQIIANKTQLERVLKFEEIIGETLQGAERIRDIVRDLKGFARVDKAEITSVNINEVLSTSISMAVPEYKYRAQLEKHFAPNLPPVLVNRGKLHQVFLNLIVNAAQAIPEGDIQNNKITVATKLEGERVRIDVSDTGQGISLDILPKIFDPFFTTKPAGFGTGLGLSICHEVISKFGGEIKVHSVLGEGSTFTVYFPAHFAKSTEKPAVQPKAGTQAYKRKNILIVDDEISLVKTMERMLQSHHSVQTALGGEAALKLIQNIGVPFDAIVCDLNMPNVSGADLYRFVAKNYPGHETNFIFITAGVYTPLMKDFLVNIRNLTLEKPFTPKELLSTIEKLSTEVV